MMFRKKIISVAIGDLFEESLAGSKKLFAALNMQARDAASLKTVWAVDELILFNDLEHARLIARDTGESRLISIAILQEQKTYKKISAA
jgi:hypothetical protein